MPLTLEDREEIREVIARYDFAIDLGDPEAYANCFTEDGAFLHTGAGSRSKMAKIMSAGRNWPLSASPCATSPKASCVTGTTGCRFSKAMARPRRCAPSSSASPAASIPCRRSSRPELLRQVPQGERQVVHRGAQLPLRSATRASRTRLGPAEVRRRHSLSFSRGIRSGGFDRRQGL